MTEIQNYKLQKHIKNAKIQLTKVQKYELQLYRTVWDTYLDN